MRAAISVCVAPAEQTAELVPRMAQADSTSPREDMGCTVRYGFRNERIRLCSPAKGDPHRGHLRPEMVSPVPPVPRRDINPETRSVSFLQMRSV